MKRFRFILTIFAISILTIGVSSNTTVDDDGDDDDPTTTKSSSVQLASSMSDTWTSSVQNTPSLNPSQSLQPNTYTAMGISISSSNSISPTSSSSYNSFSTSSTSSGWIQNPSSSYSSSYSDWAKQVSSSSSSWIKYSSSSFSSWGISPTSSYSYRSEYPYTHYYASSNNYAYPNTYNYNPSIGYTYAPNTYIQPSNSYNPSTYTYGINPSKVMDSMMYSYPVTGPPQKYENLGGPPKFPFPGGEGRFPYPGFPMGPANYQTPPNMSFPGFNGGFPMQHPVFPINPVNYQREPCEEALKNLGECCDMPKNIFKEEDLEKCRTSQPDVESEICIKSCVLSNNNMYTPENKLNQMKVVEYFVSNSNFDDTWKPSVKRAAYDCISIINARFVASVSDSTSCNMIADYLDSCIRSYFVKPCPSSKIPASLVATTCSQKMANAARCDPFAMTEARKMSNIALPQHIGLYPGRIMNPMMNLANFPVMPPNVLSHIQLGQPLPQIMPGPTRDCWRSLQMLPPNCCDRPILIPEFEFRGCENLPQGLLDSSTIDNIADNPNWCQMECIYKNRNWLKDKAIDKEMASTLVETVTDAMWQPVVKDAFYKCLAKVSEASKVDFKKCNPDPYNLMTCIDRELVMICAKKSASEVSTTIYDKCKFSMSQVENCDLFGASLTPAGIPMAADANPVENNASTTYPKRKVDEKHIIHHRVGGGSGIVGSLANGVAAGVGAGIANGVVNKIFNKGGNNGGQVQGAPQYAMPGQGGYGMQNQGPYGQGAYGQGAYGQGAYGQGAYGQGANGQGANGQGAYGQGANGQGAYGQGAYGQGANGQGAYGQGANGQGAYGQGANGQGAYGQGANGQGANGQGAYGQGAYGQQQSQYGQQGPVKQAVPMQNSQPGKGNNQKKSDKFAEAAQKVVQNKNQGSSGKQTFNPQPVVAQKTSDSKKTRSKSKNSNKKSSGGFFSKLSSKLGGGSSRRSGGGGKRG